MFVVDGCSGQRHDEAEQRASKRSRRRCSACGNPMTVDETSSEVCLYSVIQCEECDWSPHSCEH